MKKTFLCKEDLHRRLSAIPYYMDDDCEGFISIRELRHVIDKIPAVPAIPRAWVDDQIHGYASRLQSTELKALLIVNRLWEKDQEAKS